MPATELDSAAAAAATGVPWRKENAGMCSGNTGSGNVGLTAAGLLTAGDVAGLWKELELMKIALLQEQAAVLQYVSRYCKVPLQYRFTNITLGHTDACLPFRHELRNLSGRCRASAFTAIHEHPFTLSL
jgi:hypothetical protein